MKKTTARWLALAPCLFSVSLWANNILVRNVQITGDNPSEGYALVQFDLSWENSWRTTVSPNNWDAAWVFVKYRISGDVWRHAWLNNTGHSSGNGTDATLELGIQNDKQPFHLTDNPGIGVIVYRSELGAGTFSTSNMQLRWNYTANGVQTGSVVEVRVFAVEMVLARGGDFWVGDGSDLSRGGLRQIDSNTPFKITSTGGAVKCENTNHDDAQLEGSGIWIDGDGGISRSANTETDMNPDFPTGYRGFYCMKYEISQGQYRDFLNTLSREQQNQRTQTNIAGATVTNRYVMSDQSYPRHRNGLRCDATLPVSGPIEIYCDLDEDGVKNESNDGEWLACNYLTWNDGAAFMDWSGLRPMTELEFVKVCRGPNVPVAGEYVWGTADIATDKYTLDDLGTNVEGVSLNYSQVAGNAYYGEPSSNISKGPTRVGIFAANPQNTGRVSSGAGYYGAMELNGNVWERAVTIGKASGRSYSGLHGDGSLTTLGDADAIGWIINGDGAGFIGGSWTENIEYLRLSDRFVIALSGYWRDTIIGFRGCRSVAPGSAGY